MTYFPNVTTTPVTRAVHYLARWTHEDYFACGRRVTSLDQAKLNNFFSNKAGSLDSQSVATYESYALCALRIASWATVILPALGALVLLVDEMVWNYTATEFDHKNPPPMVYLFDIGSNDRMDQPNRPGSRFDGLVMDALRPMQKALFDSSGYPDKDSPELFLRFAGTYISIKQPENRKKMTAFVMGKDKEETKSYIKRQCQGVPTYSAYSGVGKRLDKASRLFLEYMISTRP